MDQGIGISLGGGAVGTAIYLILIVITLQVVSQLSMKLIVLGLITLLVATWFGMFPLAVANPTVGVFARVGVVLVLGGLGAMILEKSKDGQKDQ